MNFDYLREFLDLTATLNFTKTASNLHITQSTLSRHIAALEIEVGAPLFDRTTNLVKLTQNGRILYQSSCALMSDYSDAIAAIKENAQQKKETLCVGGSTVQPTIMRLFTKLSSRAAFEKMPIRFEYGKTRAFSNNPSAPYAIDALREGEIDLAIDTCAKSEKPPRGISSFPLCDEELTIIASEQNALAGAHDLMIKDLFSNTIVVFAVQQHCPKVLLSPFLNAGYSASRVKTIFVDNMLEIPEQLAALSVDEIVPMQKHYCSQFGFDQDGTGRLVALSMSDENLKSSFWALSRSNDDRKSVKDALQLLQAIVDDCKSLSPKNQWSDESTLLSSAFYLD